MPDPSLIITTANSQADVAQILYGLSIRGVRARSIESDDKKTLTKHPDRYQIIHESPTPIQIRIAQESINMIWDAILEEYERAVTHDGNCVFCGYDVRSLPRPTICPECGRELDTIESRRARRDRKTL